MQMREFKRFVSDNLERRLLPDCYHRSAEESDRKTLLYRPHGGRFSPSFARNGRCRAALR
jgi:hypothetical protein